MGWMLSLIELQLKRLHMNFTQTGTPAGCARNDAN